MTHQEQTVLKLNWFLFRVRPNKERAVYHSISDAGYTAALPEVTYRKRVSRHSRKMKDVSYPGLKSYILVGFEGQPVFRHILDMPFISGVVGFENFAARLNSHQVYAFLSNGAWDKRSVRKLVEEWQPDYKVGNTVKLRGAGMDGITGVVWSVDLESRQAKVSVPMFGSDPKKPEDGFMTDIPLEAAYLAEVA